MDAKTSTPDKSSVPPKFLKIGTVCVRDSDIVGFRVGQFVRSKTKEGGVFSSSTCVEEFHWHAMVFVITNAHQAGQTQVIPLEIGVFPDQKQAVTFAASHADPRGYKQVGFLFLSLPCITCAYVAENLPSFKIGSSNSSATIEPTTFLVRVKTTLGEFDTGKYSTIEEATEVIEHCTTLLQDHYGTIDIPAVKN